VARLTLSLSPKSIVIERQPEDIPSKFHHSAPHETPRCRQRRLEVVADTDEHSIGSAHAISGEAQRTVGVSTADRIHWTEPAGIW
jgi:hypothetical protein